ncbi:HsdR family type I site-specific deoxyribonuclease [Parahaliea sp. F7430]|uniref:Type I restriction enzyme endonuclease subunit n=1 Tax=Sediminihaliea albiluteola TaxID=2758564 RepID=A0A7W2TTM0_9GAMM|nr:HsdR family type I site-specific deoxyribonuclease [Sediminihaliea albiluteola]MBA6411759.1 HsdR family type I site-specific deoxyribonuclease [Sediminihaliea albiluteola]
MSKINQLERITQERLIQLFRQDLGYEYLGNLHGQNNKNINADLLTAWLKQQGYSATLINKALRQLDMAAVLGDGKALYQANKEVYRLLRYGIKESEGVGQQNETIWLIDWKNPDNNHFAIAEEVSIQGENLKRPDMVLYVNGIALGVLELKRSTVSVSEGIRQSLDNQKKAFIRNFFTTIQLVMAGNDNQGLRYGTIETPERFFLEWKEEVVNPYSNSLDFHLSLICNKQRFLQIIHDFMVFDAGVKKTCRHNQFFGTQAAKQRIAKREGGIIWHTQGSGKSLTMVWLAKWLRENQTGARVLIVTDRTELDEQIEKVFSGVDEEIYRTKSGADLIATLNQPNPWLMCTLVHKFGRQGDDDTAESEQATDEFIEQLSGTIPNDFKAKGNLFVFVDECHRTQSGKLHAAMKAIIPDAMFIGFTGTPLMKKDKQKSIEVFGSYIHTYKFDEAVEDGVVLDLRYEARDIDQHLTSPEKIDEWFDINTNGLTKTAKSQLKQRWGTLRKVLSSKSRLEKIVMDIWLDMKKKPRLKDGRGNAMLVCSSVYQACTTYDMFSKTDLAGKVAIVTSYQPTAASIKGEESGEGQTEALFKYDTYRKMLADFFEQPEEQAASRVEEFEVDVKKLFVDEPGQMRLLIVVDKLLTGFDAPSATYLYIDKQMADHNLFQAICRVNRLDGDDKEYGYIVDYKDLFKSLDKAIKSYTEGAFDGYDDKDVQGLLKDRLEQAKEDLDNSLEAVRAMCEPVKAPRGILEYQHFFCGVSGDHKDELLEKEPLRLAFYKAFAKLLRTYSNLANEMQQAGYSAVEQEKIRQEIEHYEAVRAQVKQFSGDEVDMKRLEPAMRQLIDMYIRADDSEVLFDFEELGLLELVISRGEGLIHEVPEGERNLASTMNEGIENNLRRTLVENNPLNPEYYDSMSALLDELIKKRRQQAIDYQTYLKEIQVLASKVVKPNQGQSDYPSSLDTAAKRAIYDNFGKDEVLANKIDTTIRYTKKADWVGDLFKEREVAYALTEEVGVYGVDIVALMELAKAQPDYK